MQLLTLFNAKYLQTQTKGVIFTTSNKTKTKRYEKHQLGKSSIFRNTSGNSSSGNLCGLHLFDNVLLTFKTHNNEKNNRKSNISI